MALAASPQQTVALNLTAATQVGTVTVVDMPIGSVLVVGWGIIGAGQVVTPTCPNMTFTPYVQGAINGNYEEMWIGVVAGGTSGVTITFTAATSNYSVVPCKGWVQEWRGSNGIGYLAAISTFVGSTVNQQLPTVTPIAGKNAAIIGLMRSSSAVTFGAPDQSFTDPGVSGSTVSRNLWLVVASASGSYNPTEVASVANNWSTAVLVLYDTAPSMTFSTQPVTATSGVAMTAFAVTADATASGLTCTLTLAGPNGSATGLTAVCNGSGVATFTSTVTGDGPGYTFAAALPTYAGVTSSAFTTIGAVVAANQAFVTAMGGNTSLFTVHDPRIYANGALSSFPDTIGSAGGRAAGVVLAAGTAPVVAAGKLTFTAASTQHLLSAADARLVFTDTFGAPRPLWLLVIGSCTAAGALAGIAKDPTSTTTYPYAYVKPTGSTWQAAVASDGATPTPTNPPIANTAGIFTSDSGVAFAGGLIRAMAVGRLGYQTASLDQTTNINYPWGFIPSAGGKQPRFIHRVTAATAGSCKLVLGRFGATYIDASLSWVGVYTGDLTLTKLLAFQAFAKAQFGATVDVSAIPSLAIAGNSLVNSTTQQSGGDMQQPTAGSGTTSFPYYMANKTSGSRGSLVTQGLDVAEVHSFAYGRSGGDLQFVLDTFDVELALLADGTRTGPIVIMHHDVGNSLAGGGMTQAQYLAGCIALKAKCDALATASGRVVKLVHLLDPDRVSYYNDVWPNIPTNYSAAGLARVAIGVAMLAAPATYGAAVYDCSSTTHETLGTFAAPKCYSTTYFNITANGAFGGGDATHQSPLGYQEIGEGIKTAFLDPNDGLLYPSAGALARIGFKLGLGLS